MIKKGHEEAMRISFQEHFKLLDDLQDALAKYNRHVDVLKKHLTKNTRHFLNYEKLELFLTVPLTDGNIQMTKLAPKRGK